MSNLITEKNRELAELRKAFEAFKNVRLQEIEAEEQKFNAQAERLNLEIAEELLKEKLKDFPQELVSEHANCVCGAKMRPFVFADGSRVWGCQSGDSAHDWIII